MEQIYLVRTNNFKSMIIYIIDSHPIVSDCLNKMVRDVNRRWNVVSITNMSKLSMTLIQHGQPDWIIFELQLIDVQGVATLNAVKDACPYAELMVITSSESTELKKICLSEGVNLYLTKRVSLFKIRRAFEELINLNCETFHPLKKITKRQQQIILLIENGLSNREISLKLQISEHTVKVHVWRLFKNIGAHNRNHALYILRKNNYL